MREWEYSPTHSYLGTEWRWLVIFRSRPLYRRGKRRCYRLDRKLAGYHNRRRRCVITGNRTVVVQRTTYALCRRSYRGFVVEICYWITVTEISSNCKSGENFTFRIIAHKMKLFGLVTLVFVHHCPTNTCCTKNVCLTVNVILIIVNNVRLNHIAI